MACWMRVMLLVAAAAASDRAPCAKRRDAPLDCPRAAETDVKWTFHDARRTDNGDRYFTALPGGSYVARSRGPQGNVLWGDGSRAPDVLLCGDAAHNVAALNVPGLGLVLLGGRSSQKDVRRRLAGTCPEGVERDRRKSGVRAYLLKKGSATPLFGGRSIIDGSGRVPGCVEGRSKGMWCEFDGRLSATVFRGRVHLFARANVRMGLRAVQHTSVDVRAFSNGNFSWSRWGPVEFASYSFAQSHVYFACVDAFDDFLVALAPVSFPERREAGIYAAFSTDGRAWSPLVKIRDSPFAGERQVDHPACGVLVEKDNVVLHVQREVGGIRDHFNTSVPSKDSSLARMALSKNKFADLAHKALATIGDPRALHSCRTVYGARGEYSVVTTEDAIRGKSARPAYVCDLKAPYGRFVDVAGGSDPVFFLEIPKTGSTTLKRWLGRPFAENKRNKRFEIGRSFAVVREPLQRFLSGYGTVRHRASRGNAHWPFNTTMSEPQKFEAFVDLLRREGDGLVTRRPKEGCLWFHVMSQTWFLELLNRPIDRVLRLESLEADLKVLLRDLPLLDPRNETLKPSLPPKQNTVEGNFDTRTLLRTSPRGVQKALMYLRQDYECLGYEVPVM